MITFGDWREYFGAHGGLFWGFDILKSSVAIARVGYIGAGVYRLENLDDTPVEGRHDLYGDANEARAAALRRFA